MVPKLLAAVLVPWILLCHGLVGAVSLSQDDLHTTLDAATEAEHDVWNLLAARVPKETLEFNGWSSFEEFLPSCHAVRTHSFGEFFMGIGQCLNRAEEIDLLAFGLDNTIGPLHDIMTPLGYGHWLKMAMSLHEGQLRSSPIVARALSG